MKELQDKGLGLAGISYDSPEILAAFSQQRGITFPLLSDAGSATIKAYGILNPAADWALGPDKDDPAVAAEVRKYVSVVGANARMDGMAFPGTFMLDRQGRVTSRFFEDFYIDRNTVSSVMLRLGAGTAPVAATKISTGQIDITTFPSDTAVAPGNRFSLAFDVSPHSGMHVYAPGASGYRPISVTIAPQPFVQVRTLQYPQSEIFFFMPLNERVPVFQKPFRLVQEVLLEGTPQAQAALQGKESLTIAGSVDYQACDDKVCFNPASVPVTWTLTLRPLVRERPVVPR
jgi:peroxiredoxin